MFIFISFLSANFKEIIILMLLIFVHELGHMLTALLFKWKIERICIFPLGGVVKFDGMLNSSIFEEFLIVLMGPFFQCVFFLFLCRLDIDNLFFLNSILLIFNLLPIYPLDGGKILNLFLSYFIPYKLSLKVSFYFSFFIFFLCFVFFVFVFKSYFFIFVFMFLFFKLIFEFNNISIIYNKFLLEKYFYRYCYKKCVYCDDVFSFYRNRNHYFYMNDVLVSERTFLKNYFNVF